MPSILCGKDFKEEEYNIEVDADATSINIKNELLKDKLMNCQIFTYSDKDHPEFIGVYTKENDFTLPINKGQVCFKYRPANGVMLPTGLIGFAKGSNRAKNPTVGEVMEYLAEWKEKKRSMRSEEAAKAMGMGRKKLNNDLKVLKEAKKQEIDLNTIKEMKMTELRKRCRKAKKT